MELYKAYEILGVTDDSSEKEIKSAFTRLSKEYHPEENPKQYRMIYEAYRIAIKQSRNNRNKKTEYENKKSYEYDNSYDAFTDTSDDEEFSFDKISGKKDSKLTETVNESKENKFDFKSLSYNNTKEEKKEEDYDRVFEKVVPKSKPKIDIAKTTIKEEALESKVAKPKEENQEKEFKMPFIVTAIGITLITSFLYTLDSSTYNKISFIANEFIIIIILSFAFYIIRKKFSILGALSIVFSSAFIISFIISMLNGDNKYFNESTAETITFHGIVFLVLLTISLILLMIKYIIKLSKKIFKVTKR